jgi:hypothetical protein
MIIRPFSLKNKVFGIPRWLDHPSSLINTFSLQAHHAKSWWDFVSQALYTYVVTHFWPHRKSRKEKRKK